ncbi:MAG: B12-binding domain-containing radical SAM protein [Spirochaetia bacterium]|nr:B12-binding domain-containing radical SAM protein [Spirochaetia bacterium]
MTKILMIQPKSHDTFWQMSAMKPLTKKKAIHAPLGLVTLAALTPPQYEVELLDEYVEELKLDTSIDLVAITGFTMHLPRIREIVSQCKEMGIMTVGGGPFVSGHIEEARELFDVVVVGEAEKVWPVFLEEWSRNSYKKFYEGGQITDLSISPVPRWGAIKNLDDYSSAPIQTSRGCPYDCEFCDVVSLFGRKPRFKPVENVIAELKDLISRGKAEIFFADDNFIGNRVYAKSLLKEIIKFNRSIKKPIRFFTQLTLNVVKDPELIDLFVDANFYGFFIGVETPSKESLLSTNKSHNADLDLVQAIRTIQSRGIFLSLGMIVGFDADSSDIFDLQYDFLTQAGVAIPLISMLTAMRGTKLWDRLEAEGRLLADLESGDTNLEANFIPKLMTKEALQSGYAALYRRLYEPENFYIRFAALIDQVDLKSIHKYSYLKNAMDPRHFRIYFLGAMYRTVKFYIFNSDKNMRRLFWKCLRKAIKKDILLFPWVIEILMYFMTEADFIHKHFVIPGHNTFEKLQKTVVKTSLSHVRQDLN